MKTTIFALLLTCAMPVSATLISYDYTGYAYDTESRLRIEATGTVVFDTALLNINKFTVDFDDANLIWRPDTDSPMQMTSDFGSIHYLWSPGGSFDGNPVGYWMRPVWEVHLLEPTSLFTVLTNFNRYWMPETSPEFQGKGDLGILQFTSVSQPYSVPEPATLSLLFLGLAAIGIRRRLR